MREELAKRDMTLIRGSVILLVYIEFNMQHIKYMYDYVRFRNLANRIERLIQFNSNKEILSNYYFDLEKLFLTEFLTNRIVYHDNHIYVKYNTKLLYNPLIEAFFALIFYKRDHYIF
jgi:hypothetical protein